MKFWPFKKDKGELQQTFAESCTGEPNVTREIRRPKPWSPHGFNASIMVAGNLRRSRSTATAVMNVQRELARQFADKFPGTKLQMCVQTFLDDCRHSTGWSDRPEDIGSSSTRWHCYQTNTRFHEAFTELRNTDRPEEDIIILVGGRFDDDPALTAQAAKQLFEEKRIRIFCLPDPDCTPEIREAFRLVAESAGGKLLDMPQNLQDAEAVMQEISTFSMFMKSGRQKEYIALPPPANSEAQKARRLLEGPK